MIASFPTVLIFYIDFSDFIYFYRISQQEVVMLYYPSEVSVSM